MSVAIAMNRSFRFSSLLTVTLVASAFLLANPARASDQVTLDQGRWTKKTYSVSGSWKIVREGDKRFLVISGDFRTKNGPDLKVFLSPRALGDVTSRNATRDSRLVSRLPRHKGAQRIEIPAGVDLAQYKTVLIHCKKYSVLFTASALNGNQSGS
ncbi:MAG: DM13 domain-containing protein [Proteobacteria bacterium]|nr:DM13 domain-containing protein [Pseudomonadota bacterium]